MRFYKCLTFCALACAVSGVAVLADNTSSPNYTGVSSGKSSTTGSYGARDLSQTPHYTAPHYTPPHFDNQGNFHESHQSYGHYVDPSNNPHGHRRRNRY